MSTCANCGEPLDGNARCDNCLTFDTETFHELLDRDYRDTSISDPDDPKHVKKDTFHEKVKLLYPRLERLAINGDKATYEEVSDDLGLFTRGYYLRAVAFVETHDGRPILPSIVVRREDGVKTFPEDGYFTMIRALELGPDNIDEWDEERQKEWWAPKLEEVHSFWENRDYTPPKSY